MTTPEPVEFTDVTISYIPPEDRQHPDDCIRVEYPGKKWSMTVVEYAEFNLAARGFLIDASQERDRERREGDS
jgi:hypothetical protein